MPVEHCYHVKENGFYCQQPALRGRRHCHTHLRILGRRMRMARERARQLSRPLVLPPLEDMDSVMVALSQVLDARAEQRITEATAGLMLYGLQQAASNLKWMEERAARDENKECGERAEEYPGFEAEFGLPEGFDLEQPPEVAFPPPDSTLPAAPEPSPYRDPSLAWQQFSPEDVELEELYDTGHVEDYHRRFKEMMARSDQERAAHKQKVAKARWVLEADRRNHELALGRPIERRAPKTVAGTAESGPAQPPAEAEEPQNGGTEKSAKTVAPVSAHKEEGEPRRHDAGRKPPKKAVSGRRAGGHAGRQRR